MITENLSTLKIHKLTKAQYERELAAGSIDPTALYLTPDEENAYVTPNVLANALEKKITSPSVAVVGQILYVKAVDESGKPTEWGLATLPETTVENGVLVFK